MSKKHLKLESHRVDNQLWWYEERFGITIVIENRNKNGEYIETKQKLIRWSDIRAALKRKDKK